MHEKEKQWLLEEKWGGSESPGFFEDCKRLENGEPLAYVIGFIPFLNTKIYLDSRPLIPRPETEYWAERAIIEILHTKEPHVLDLCAGSGCIGVALLVASPHATVDFVEIEIAHHETIRKNILKNHIDATRARIYTGDLFEGLTGSYDFILSNPPYIAKNNDRSEKSVREHEPNLALYGGSDGLDIIRRVLSGATTILSEHGVLYIEHEPEHTDAILDLGASLNFSARTECDQFGNLRYTRLCRREVKTVTE